MENMTEEHIIKHIYDRFNARDIDGVFSKVADDVAWANGMEGGHVQGKEALRAYWTHQWSVINPHVDPIRIKRDADSVIAVEVHQVVHDLEGTLLLDESVVHAFTVGQGKVLRFDIRSESKLSKIPHE